jgi:hypothetical protein
MNKTRKIIKQIKANLSASLEANTPKYRRAIVRELEYLWSQARDQGMEFKDFVDVVKNKFSIPPSARAAIVADLQESQQQIMEVWGDYFSAELDAANIQLKQSDIDKMLALYKVDFSSIKSTAGDIIMEAIRKTARTGNGIEDLRSRLRTQSLGEGEVNTLANTALSQLDNASMHEYAAQGGIDLFLYDGVAHPNSRPFCLEHLGNEYTLAEIMKMNNGQGLPVLTSCGGYNCTHFWTPVVK